MPTARERLALWGRTIFRDLGQNRLSQAGVVVTTKANARLKHIEFVRLDTERALVVLVSQAGEGTLVTIALPRR